jgi:ATP-dependent exoDNAse (exonuclease V) beta subunit
MIRSPVGGVKKIETKCPGFEEFRKRYNDSLLSSSHKRVIENYINALFDLAELWRNDFIKYKQENHIISYNDMEKIFLRLLTDFDEVKDYVRENYKLVMVDEFQDSNPIQIKIFNVLSEIIAENDGRSYWVGDPKQAIYAFRGADADLISSITSKFKFYNDANSHDNDDENGLGTRRLTESWRSRKSLVTLVNDVFEPLFKQDKFQERMKRLVTSSESLDERENVHKIQASTLIVTSEYDFLVPKLEQEFLNKNIPNSHYMIIPNFGHGWMYEDLTLFVTVMIGFVLSGGNVKV